MSNQKYLARKYKKGYRLSTQDKDAWVREWNRSFPAGTCAALRIDGRVRRVVLDEPAELLAGVPVVRLPSIGLVRLSQVEVME